MILIVAVIVGYILGIMPFIMPNILQKKEEHVEKKQDEINQKKEMEIFDEWLNGVKTVQIDNKINQADIYQEYTTGETAGKGD